MLEASSPALQRRNFSPSLLLPDLPLSTALLLLLQLKSSTQSSPALCSVLGSLPPCCSRAQVLLVLLLGTNTPQLQLQTDLWPARTSLGAATCHQPRQFWRAGGFLPPPSPAQRGSAPRGWQSKAGESWSLSRGCPHHLRSLVTCGAGMNRVCERKGAQRADTGEKLIMNVFLAGY